MKEEIIKKNISFIYGRNQEDYQHDLDKRTFVKSVPKIEEKVINAFEKEHFFLAPSFPCQVFLADEIDLDDGYLSFEHGLHASKFESSDAIRSEIKQTKDIREVKRKFRIQPDEKWKNNCLTIGENLLRDKFVRDKKLKSMLMKTVDFRLIYQNDHGDSFWGVISGNRGTNHLGKILEKIRKEIQDGNEIDCWLSQSFNLLPKEKVCFQFNCFKDEIIIQEDCKTYPKFNKIYLGKSDDNDYVISHPSISRNHAVIIADINRGLTFIDLGSANGSFMNDVQLKPFKPYLITPSSRFKFGEYSRTYTIEVNTNYDILRNQEISKKVIDTTEDSDEDEENTIFVGQIPHEATEKQIFDFFKSCGSIKKISYPIDKQTMLPRGIAFVTFDNSSSLLQALSRDRDIMLGRPVRIKKNVLKSKPNTEQNDKNRSSKNSDNYNPNRDKSSKYRDSASSSDRLYTESFRRDERQSPPHKRKFGEANR